MTTPQHTCPICHRPGDKHCKDCKTAFYCSQACQKADWPFHKPACRFKQAHPASSEPQSIPCVKIHSPHTRYENVTVPSTHPIFTSRALPVTVKFGYSLVMTRLVENLPRGRQTDNQHATWLNIDPESGFAPPEWQGGIGSVVVANADGTSLDSDTLGAIVDYVSEILDAFGDGEVPRRKYNRRTLDQFLEQHLKMQNKFKAGLQ